MSRTFLDGAALFLDVDGTLLDIAATPTEVVVPRPLIDILKTLDQALDGALALVSGRIIADLDRLFQPLSLRASGVHGAEMRYAPRGPIEWSESAAILPRELWLSVNAAVASFPGVLLEDKRFSIAVHYRATPEAGPRLRETLREIAKAMPGGGYEIFEAHLAFELKAGHFNKGIAIMKFLERPPFVGRAPVFVGDDWTDESGFAAVRRFGGAAYSVGEARAHVTGVFSEPREVREWLKQLTTQMAMP